MLTISSKNVDHVPNLERSITINIVFITMNWGKCHATRIIFCWDRSHANKEKKNNNKLPVWWSLIQHSRHFSHPHSHSHHRFSLNANQVYLIPSINSREIQSLQFNPSFLFSVSVINVSGFANSQIEPSRIVSWIPPRF